MSNKSVILKNVSPQTVFQSLGNPGTLFPYKQCEIPDEPVCPLCLQENRQIELLTNEGEIILVDCRN